MNCRREIVGRMSAPFASRIRCNSNPWTERWRDSASRVRPGRTRCRAGRISIVSWLSRASPSLTPTLLHGAGDPQRVPADDLPDILRALISRPFSRTSGVMRLWAVAIFVGPLLMASAACTRPGTAGSPPRS